MPATTAPTTWPKLCAARRGHESELLHGWSVLLVCRPGRPGSRSWVAQLVNPVAVVVRSTAELATRSWTPRHALHQAQKRWFRTTGLLPVHISPRSARRFGWTGPLDLSDRAGLSMLRWHGERRKGGTPAGQVDEGHGARSVDAEQRADGGGAARRRDGDEAAAGGRAAEPVLRRSA